MSHGVIAGELLVGVCAGVRVAEEEEIRHHAQRHERVGKDDDSDVPGRNLALQAADLDDEDERRRYEADHDGVDLLEPAGHGCASGLDLGHGAPGRDEPADDDAGKQRAHGHEHGVGHFIEERQPVESEQRGAGFLEDGDVAERDADRDRHEKADARDDERGALAVGVEFLDDELRHDLDQRHDGGDGGDVDHDEKGERHDLTHAAHGLEHLRQDDEHERDALAAAEQRGVEVRNRREDCQTCDERHERVEDADHGGGAHEIHFFAGVRAVGDHDAHAERQGVKRLTHGHEHGLERDAGEIGLEIEAQPLTHAAAERQRVDGDGDEDQKQHRHEHLGGLLDAVLDAAHDDHHAQHEEDRGVENDLARVDGERADDAGVAAEGVERVLGRPAAEHGVVADDERGDHDRHESAPAEVLVDHLVGGHGVCLRAATEIDLAEHRHEADEQHARNVDEHEGRAAVLRRLVREAPEVSEPHGAARGGEDEADAAGESNFFLFHNRFPFRPFFLYNKKSAPTKTVGADSWYTKSCLSREYRFGSFCWRCDAQNAEYSKNRHCKHSVDGKQKDAVVVGIRRRACRADRALGRGIAGTRKGHVTHGLQLLSEEI